MFLYERSTLPGPLAKSTHRAEQRAAAADAELAFADNASEARAVAAEKKAAEATTALAQASVPLIVCEYVCVCMCVKYQ
jgi:hypothetical protein